MQEVSHLLQKQNPNLQRIGLPTLPSSQQKESQRETKQKRKKSIMNKNYRPIVVNLQDTRYQVIERTCEQFGWRLDYCVQVRRDWDIKWTDYFITPDVLSKMSSHQKINHFPGMITLFRKNNLAKNLRRMQQLTQQHYDFYPRTFLLPHDGTHLRTYIQEIRRNNIKKTFIVKPQADCQGRGIYLTQSIQEIDTKEHCVVQKYISNPLLYKGLKFDLRIYVLIAGCDPLRIYIYNQGLVRFATEKYEFPNNDNLDNLCMHLTNYAINKNHPNYVFNESTDDLSQGHKKSLAQFFRTLKSMGLKANSYWTSIKDIVIKTMIAGQPHLQHECRVSQPHNLLNNMCFEILGFDFMIDGNHNCSLIEINHTPSFSTDTPLDDLVKSNLIKDTLLLMNINQATRKTAQDQAREIQQRRVLTGKVNRLTPDQRLKRVMQLQEERQAYERENLGSYQRIFPSKNPTKQAKYEDLLKISTESYKEQSSGMKSSHRLSPVKKATANKFRVKRIETNQTIKDDEDQPPTTYIPKGSKTPTLRKAGSQASDSKRMTPSLGATTMPFGRGYSLENKASLLYDPQFNQSAIGEISSTAYQKCLTHLLSKRANFDMILPTNNSSFTMFSKHCREAGSVPKKPVIK